MSTEILRIVSVDPGVTTGIAVHEVMVGHVNPFWRTEELGPDKHHLLLWQLLCNVLPDVIVCERFEYRNVKHRGTEMPGIRLESREYIGVCKLYSQMFPHCLLAMSVTANKGPKALWSPDKLKALGLYRAPGGRQHMNDATAHALHYITEKYGRKDYFDKLRHA